MTTVGQAPPPCPPWCDRKHAASWNVHTRELGQVHIGSTVVDALLHQYGNDSAPVLTLVVHGPDSLSVIEMPADAADDFTALVVRAKLATLGATVPTVDARTEVAQ